MLRWTIPLLFALVAIGTGLHPEPASARQGRHESGHRAVKKLPAGLPRAHYDFRTTISYRAPYRPHLSRRPYAPRYDAYEAPDVLFTPVYAEVRYVPRFGTPLLPGSATLPGYYGSTDSYDYQGPYYGGPDFGYWDRLPYGCGVYGYC